MVLAIGDTNDGNDELANQHAERTPDEQRTTAESFNGPEGDRGRADVDKSRNERDEEGVGNGAELLEECGTVVEDEVDTSPLLHHLKRSAKDGAAQVGVGLPEAAAEAVEPGVEVIALRNDLELILVVGNDFGKLLLNILGINRLATETGEHVGSTIELASLDEVTWRLRQEKQANAKDESPEHLNGHRDAVGAGVEAILGAVVHAGCKQNTNGNAELVSGDERATDLARRDLRHVQDDDSRDESDTETSNNTARDKELVVSGSDLKNDSGEEDAASRDDGGAATNEIGAVTSNQSTQEGTEREEGHDHGLLP